MRHDIISGVLREEKAKSSSFSQSIRLSNAVPLMALLPQTGQGRPATDDFSLSNIPWEPPSELNVGNPRVEGEAVDAVIADPHHIVQRLGLAGEGLAIDLVKRDHGALGHAGKENIQRLLGRFIEIEIEIDQRHDGVGVLLEKAGRGDIEVTLD